MAPITFNRLIPVGDPVEAGELVQALELEVLAPSDRPYTVVNFVATVDGNVSFRGRSGAIGDDGDQALFHALRERADAVLAGTGTLKAERYGRILGKPERRQRRIASGRSPEPLACVISRSGEVPTDIPLFAEAEAEIVLFSPAPPPDGVAAHLHPEPYDPRAERPLADALAKLRHRYGVSVLLCEGGPALFGALLGEQLVDELFLTIASKLAGGDAGPGLTSGPPLPELASLHIRWALERHESLYLRYALGD